MSRVRRLVIGTRRSKLALAQTEIVVQRLRELYPNLSVKIVPIVTRGDRALTARELRRLDKGVFVREIETRLLRKTIDIAVHSLKDMPTELPEGLTIGAVLQREDPADLYIGRTATPLEKLPPHSIVGTSSLRRRAFLRAAFRHLQFEDLRGNLDTRLARLREPGSRMAGIVVAAAGFKRLFGARAPMTPQPIPLNVLPPAPGQGAICIELRADRPAVRDLIAPLDDEPTRASVQAERAILRRLGGGCNVPIAAYGVLYLGLLKLACWVASPDGRRIVHGEVSGSPEDVESIADALEVILKNKGVSEIIREIRQQMPAPTCRLPAPSNGRRENAPKRKPARRKR